MYYPKNLSRTTLDPAECDRFFTKRIVELKADPNNYIYDYEPSVTKKIIEESPEFHVWKRRQRTKDGDPVPKSPCDDKGLPLFVDPAGNLVTKSDGNQIAWGPWVDGTEEGVSLSTVTVPKRWCNPNRIRAYWGGALSSFGQAERAIQSDKQQHDRQQGKRKNQIRVEYAIKQTKEATSHPEWECEIDEKEVRNYPDDWISPSFNPGIPLGTIVISLKGTGTFSGRKAFTQNARAGHLFGTAPLEETLLELGFENPDIIPAHWGRNFYLNVPEMDDMCVVKPRRVGDWRMGSVMGDTFALLTSDFKHPLGGRFSTVDFNVSKRVGTDIKSSGFIDYEKRAPKRSVEFCHKMFRKAVERSIIKIEEDL